MTVNHKRTPTGSYPTEPGLVLTFDDNSIYDWTLLRKVLNKYGTKACFYISGIHTHVSPQEAVLLQLLEKDGNEIGSHSLNHASAKRPPYKGDPQGYIRDEVLPSIRALEDLGLSIDSFSYPFGEFTHGSDLALGEILASIRRYTFYTFGGNKLADLDLIYYPLGQANRYLYAIGIDRNYNNSIEDFKAGLDRAKSQGAILPIYGHQIKDEGDYAASLESLEAIISYAQEIGLSFYTPADLAGYSTWTKEKIYPVISELVVKEGEPVNPLDYWQDLPDFLQVSSDLTDTSDLKAGSHYLDVKITDGDSINDRVEMKIIVEEKESK